MILRIELPDGSEIIITELVRDLLMDFADADRPITPTETANVLVAMERIVPFDMTDEERASAEAWEKQVNDYTIANLRRDRTRSDRV